jgi:hypothetical protein
MDRRIILCGLVVATFVLTLAFSSWHEDLWRSDPAPATRAVASHPSGSPESAAVPAVMAAPAATEMNPSPAVAAAPEPAQSEPQSEPDSTANGDSGERLARRERGSGRGSRSR